MTRAAARTTAATALTGTSLYTDVLQGAPDTFDGRTPVAVISSATMEVIEDTRSLYSVRSTLHVSIYVRKPSGESGASTAEDTLDALVRASLIALHQTGAFDVGASSASPDGFPLRAIDGVLYRIERLPLVVLDET